MTNIRGRLSGDNWSAANVYGIGIFGEVFSISPMPHTTNTTQGMGENIGRIGSLEFFWQISVIAVFPLKTGDSMFVGFDSQNTSHSFPHYPNWNLWVWGISLFGFRGGSGVI